MDDRRQRRRGRLRAAAAWADGNQLAFRGDQQLPLDRQKVAAGGAMAAKSTAFCGRAVC